MNRIELVEKIADEHGLTKAGAARILDTVFSSIVTAVKKNEGFSYVGFGTFKQHARPARKGHNPRTGEALKLPATKIPKFVPGTAFKAAVDPKAAARKAAKSPVGKGSPAAKGGARSAAQKGARKSA